MTGISWMHLHICPCNAAQTFISAFASFVLAGAVASSTLATLQFVSHPKTWVEGERHVLVWRKRYAVPLIIFPVVALGTFIGVTLRLDAVHPSNNSMTCEATNPVWVRFLGYAGAPLLLCLPSFGATVYCMVRVYKTHQHIRRSRTRYPDSGAPQRHDVFTAPPSRTRNRTRARGGLPIEGGTDVGTDNEIEHMSSSNTLTTASARRFHFPFGHASRTDVNGGKDGKDGLKDGSRNSSRISMPRDVVSSDSTDSDAFPTFAPPSNTPSILEVGVGIGVSREGPEGKEGDVTSVGETDVEKDVWRLKDMDASHTDTEIDGAMEMIQWRKGSIEQVSTMNMMGGMEGRTRVRHCDDDDDDDRSSWDKRVRHSTGASRVPFLTSRTFNVLQLMSSISTLVYAIRGHSPPFILHHVCMVLFAWAPVLFFGPLPEVRQQLRFWSRRPPPHPPRARHPPPPPLQLQP
ncbi:hypothetical protein EYR36_003187 [Pleurotus pulmonarius]|nr:hypothetical protein EYR36_003187 [Pleurotus pulmonarius]KAF4582452.1 hypothetical protein EYR38_002577 [Pleurotus pulmonarius]